MFCSGKDRKMNLIQYALNLKENGIKNHVDMVFGAFFALYEVTQSVRREAKWFG